MQFFRPIVLLLIILFINTKMFSQVGIGTTTPDPSSILDLTSTSQGVLTPRMTSAQRLAIANPVEGLLVFDTEQDSFYYYNSGSWIKLEGAVKRDNYKLVKSVTDLADELAAGGGSKYLLNTDFLYEINGTVLINFPIELNGAYIQGLDNTGDVLVNNSGSALISGTTGGNLKNMTLIGNGQSFFNISGTGSENVVFNSVNFFNGGSLGNLSNLGLVFFNIAQFRNNTSGITAYDINSYFMNNVFWNSSNAGTFLRLAGTFENLQLANGRVVVDTGEIGLDVSNDPIISLDASLSQISFAGDGDKVVGYSTGGYVGYNFNNNWDVNCQGIPLETDNNATGDIHLDTPIGSGFVTAFSGTGTSSRTKLAGFSSSDHLFRFNKVGSNRIVYDGNHRRNFQVTTTISFQGDNNNSIFIFYIAKGNSGDATATVLEETKVYREVGENNDVGAAAIVGDVELSQGDFVEVWAERYSGGGNLLTVSLNLVAN